MAAIGTHAPGGLAIDQLLKLVASGRITAEKYAELTGDIHNKTTEEVTDSVTRFAHPLRFSLVTRSVTRGP